MEYDPKSSLKEVYQAALPCQSSIYTSCSIPEEYKLHPYKILHSSLLKNFKLFDCSKAPKIDVQEKMYAYLPESSEIIAIHVFRTSETPLELITGITWTSSEVLNENCQNQPPYFFNIYESTLDYDLINCIDSLELDFVPFQLTSFLFDEDGQQKCFVLSGSDAKMHVFCYSQDQTYAEVEAEDLFPEFAEAFSSIALFVDFRVKDEKRYTALALECGTLVLCVTDLEKNEVLETLNFSFEGPLTKVAFFETDEVKLLAVASLSLSRIFYDIETEGLSKSRPLPKSDEFDVAACATLADIDFDGNPEILIGTYGEQLLVYKEEDEKWSLKWIKSLNNPIHQIFHLDLTGDGVKDFFIVTLKTIIILQHDYDQLIKILENRLTIDA